MNKVKTDTPIDESDSDIATWLLCTAVLEKVATLHCSAPSSMLGFSHYVQKKNTCIISHLLNHQKRSILYHSSIHPFP